MTLANILLNAMIYKYYKNNICLLKKFGFTDLKRIEVREFWGAVLVR